MTPDQIEIVQSTFKEVLKIKDQAADLFYNRLFEMDPSLRGMFPGDMKSQKQKLMATIGVAVAGLKNPPSILATVKALGARHADYGVTARHYDTVGAALIWTLEQGLGPAFTPQVKEAWLAVYGLLSSVMQEAANEKPIQDELKMMLAQTLHLMSEGKLHA